MSKELFDMSETVALITGSRRGLGRAIAEGLAAAGATVAINGRGAEAVEQAVSQLTSAGFSAIPAPFDVTNPEEVDAGVGALESSAGRVDILINNAGVIRRSPLLELEVSDWEDVIRTNLTGAFILSRRVARGMIEAGGGKVINTCSILSTVARETVSAYSSAKAGLLMLTQQMAAEWAKHNIQANAIGPGFFATDMTAPLQADEAFDSWLRGRVPAGRWGEPRELVGPALFLSSRASDFVNGQIIYVDGGVLARM